MPTSLLILSDTHVPSRARDLPPPLWDAIEAADVVIHAGDWVSIDHFDELSSRCRRLIGVAGNNDGPELHQRLPEFASEILDGVRVAVIHETGGRDGREARCDARFADVADVLIFGHSHIPWDTVTPRGLRLLNPGSPTDRRRQPVGTYLTAVADAGELRDVTLVPVEK